MNWNKEHVQQWILWAIKEFSLKDIDVDKFDMDGRDLCRLTRDDFMKLAPAYNGDILMAHLCVLRKSKYHFDAIKIEIQYVETMR